MDLDLGDPASCISLITSVVNGKTPTVDLDLEDPASRKNNFGGITIAGEDERIGLTGASEEGEAASLAPGISAVCVPSGHLSNEVRDSPLVRNPLIRKNGPGGSICQDISADTTGWKRRKRAVDGPDSRLCPSNMSAIDMCLLNAKDRSRPEIFAPVEGTTFDSCQEAYEMYNLFSWECGFGIKHAKTRLNGKGYRTMHELVCQCYGKSDKENSATTKTGCKAMIRLLRTEDHGWYVNMFVNVHNHHLSEKCVEKRQWKSHNCIDPMTKSFIRNLRENNISLGKIYNILCGVNSEPGVAPYRKDTLKYLCSRMSQESAKTDIADTIRLLREMRVADGNLVVSINVDREGSVKSILWCTGKNREDYAHFGDVVTFDTTYRTNLYNMPFGLFVGVNNYFQSTIFGGVLLRQETIVDFEWAFKTFVETMNGKHPQTMLTDQCKAMESAIKNVLPHTRHRWYKWHVVKCAKEKLGFVYSKHSTFKREFHSLINDVMDAMEFEKKWEILIVKYNLSTNVYLENMYANRQKWAKPYFSAVFCAGMTSTQRSESANHMLKQYIPRSSPMHLFVKQYNNILRSRITDEGKEDFVTKMYLPCAIRHLLAAYIAREKSKAARDHVKMWNPFLVTREALQFEVLFQETDMAIKICGEGWNEMTEIYVVRPGDVINIYIPRSGYTFFVDIERDGVQQIPLCYIAKRGLSTRKRKCIDECIYTRGQRYMLQYPAMKRMVKSAFAFSRFPCCIYVHKLSGSDIEGGYMRIPKRVVDRIEEKTGTMDAEGMLMLLHGPSTQVEAAFKKTADNRMLIQGGFRAYANGLGLKVDDVVVICFQKDDEIGAMKVWITVVA